MSAAGDRARELRHSQSGARLTARISQRAYDNLQLLASYHRLPMCEALDRLLCHTPMSASRVNPLGLSEPEQAEYERQLRNSP